MGELAVVARGQPVLLLVISMWSPPRFLAWQKGSRLGSGLIWKLLGLLLLVVFLRSLVNAHGTLILEIGWIFIFGCPLCAAAVLSCGAMGDRWVRPHLAVRTWFAAERWTAQVTQP